MKEIPNQQFTEKDTTVSLLTQCLDFTQIEKGFAIGDLKARARVDKALAEVKAGDIIKLEDSDYAVAQQAIREVRWLNRKPHLITFAEQFGL
jgi:hypothetical protein